MNYSEYLRRIKIDDEFRKYDASVLALGMLLGKLSPRIKALNIRVTDAGNYIIRLKKVKLHYEDI